MAIKIKLFAAFRETVGQGELSWPLDDAPQSVGDILKALTSEYPALAAASKSAMIMVNRRYADQQTLVKAGDEVAFLPPVGGG